jgi:hypothetical protein
MAVLHDGRPRDSLSTSHVTPPRPTLSLSSYLPFRPSPDYRADGAVGRCPVLLVLVFFLREAVDGDESLARAWHPRREFQKYLK